MRWNRLGRDEGADGDVAKEEERKSQLVVVTDACLPLLGHTEMPISARLLINYELPTKKVYILWPDFSLHVTRLVFPSVSFYFSISTLFHKVLHS